MIVKGADILQDSFAKPDANATQHLVIPHMNPDYIFGGKDNDSFLDAELVRAVLLTLRERESSRSLLACGADLRFFSLFFLLSESVD